MRTNNFMITIMKKSIKYLFLFLMLATVNIKAWGEMYIEYPDKMKYSPGYEIPVYVDMGTNSYTSDYIVLTLENSYPGWTQYNSSYGYMQYTISGDYTPSYSNGGNITFSESTGEKKDGQTEGQNWSNQYGKQYIYVYYYFDKEGTYEATLKVQQLQYYGGTTALQEGTFTITFYVTKDCTSPTVKFSSENVYKDKTSTSFTLTATAKVNGTSTGQSITYTSSNPGVATVNSSTGEVTLKGVVGSTIITASVQSDATYCEADGSYTLHVYTNPTVNQTNFTQVSLTPTSSTFKGCQVSDKGGLAIVSYGYVIGTSSEVEWDTKTVGAGANGDPGLNVDFPQKAAESLTSGTKYYIRGFAYNGKAFGYTNAKTFTTPYEIVLDKNNSDASGSSSGSAYAIPANTKLVNITVPTRTGYIVEGYYNEAACTNKVADNTGTFQANVSGQTDANSKYIGNGSKLYTKWTPNTYTISFNANGGTGTMSNVTKDYGSSYTLPANGFTAPTGKVFNGWAEGSATGSPYTEGSSYTVKGDVTFYAKWADKAYDNANAMAWCADESEVNYYVPDGNGNMVLEYTATAQNGAVDYYQPLYGCADKRFVGWTTSTFSISQSAPTPLYTSDDYFDGTKHSITEDTDLYAVYASPNGGKVIGSDAHMADDFSSAVAWSKSASFIYHPSSKVIYEHHTEDGYVAYTQNSDNGSGIKFTNPRKETPQYVVTSKINDLKALSFTVNTGGCAFSYKVEASLNGTSWEEVKTGSLSGSQASAKTESIVMPTIDDYFIKITIYITSATNSYNAYLKKVEYTTKERSVWYSDYSNGCGHVSSATLTFVDDNGTTPLYKTGTSTQQIHKTQSVPERWEITEETAPTKEGYTFDYFTINDHEHTPQYGIGDTYTLAYDATATTYWKKNPTMELTQTDGTVLVTSRQEINIMAAKTLSLTISDAADGCNVTLTGDNLKFYQKNGEGKYVAISNLTTPITSKIIYVSYNPTTVGTGSIENAEITVQCQALGKTFTKSFADLVKVRNLPEQVVIAAKVGSRWYALPADISKAQNPDGEIIATNTVGGILTAYTSQSNAYKLWPVKTTQGSQDRFAQYGERLRWAGQDNYALWANNAADKQTIRNYAAVNAIGDNPTEAYEWAVTTTEVDGEFVYTFRTNQDQNTNTLSLWGGKWGTYAYGTEELYVLPFSEREMADLSVMEWADAELAVRYENGAKATTVSAKIGDGASQTIEISPIGGDLYRLTGFSSLKSQPNKLLELTITENGTQKTAFLQTPLMIGNGEEKSNTDLTSAAGGENEAKNTEVVVLGGGTFTTADNNGKFSNVYVYPGGNLKFTNKISIGNLYLRGGYSFLNQGSWDMPNAYMEAQVLGAGTDAGIVFDFYINADKYYDFCLPYQTSLESVTDEDGNTDFPVGVQYYNGEKRATGHQVSGWDWYNGENFEAGVGYAIAAKPKVTGRPYAIIRYPIYKAAYTGENSKTVSITVGNWGYDNIETLGANNVGWNMIGNPYMSKFKAADNSMVIEGELQKHPNETNWDGTWYRDTQTVRFITVPYDTEDAYHHERLSDYPVSAFGAFFIQSKTAGSLTLTNGATRTDAAPIRRAPAAARETSIDILLSGDMEAHQGKAGFVISNDYSASALAFEDQEQWFGRDAVLTAYSIIDGKRLAYNLLPELTAEGVIPLGYTATVAGSLSVSVRENDDLSSVESIILTDLTEGVSIDLLTDDYSFQTAAGQFDDRFTISIRLRSEDEVLTAVSERGWQDEVRAAGTDGRIVLHNLPADADVWVYDMTGKLIASQLKDSRFEDSVVRMSVPAGVYNIRVVSGTEAVTLRTIVR